MRTKNSFRFILASLIFSSVFYCSAKTPVTSWDLLKKLVLIPGVSGHEEEVTDFIQSAFPAEVKPNRDDMNNIWFTVGKGKPHLLFVAHTDELGLVVDRITERGTLKVKSRGGFFPLIYEARPVRVYTKKGVIEGVVSPRPEYLERNSDQSSFSFEGMEIYLGVSEEEEARLLGISEGDPITIRKRIVELSPELISTRAVDDRAGCAALLAAALQIDWKKIKGKTITFAWDVQEEIGLIGASRLAQTLKVDCVFPVDTFVSSDGPLDSKRFALLPLGKGAVLRAIDSSNIAPQVNLKKVMKIARDNNIPFQLGNTRGGNDGSVFVPEGAVDIPLSWPGTYSHSFIEKIHRRDLQALTRLITAIVKNW